MNVLYALDNNFFRQMLVSLKSLIKNTQHKLNIYIICDDISIENKSKLETFKNARINILFKNAPVINSKLVTDRGSKSQFYRLYLAEIFSSINEVSRLIYLDCDTLINSNEIEELASVDLQDSIIGATIDPWSKKYKQILNIPTTKNMFNSGILVVDVEAWKNNEIERQIDELIMKRKHFVQADQGILNEIFKGRFFILNGRL